MLDACCSLTKSRPLAQITAEEEAVLAKFSGGRESERRWDNKAPALHRAEVTAFKKLRAKEFGAHF